MTTSRKTKYSIALANYLQVAGHATNAEILRHLRSTYPELSATTVHRITSNMVERGQLALAPHARDNSMRFDANLRGHDHFECMDCDCLRDINLPPSVLDELKKALGGCEFNGHINIQGTCTKCLNNKE